MLARKIFHVLTIIFPGKPLSEVYNNWKSDEPNDADGEEDCVEQDNMGKMNDVKCSRKLSFICKKILPTLEQNNSCNKGRLLLCSLLINSRSK